MAKNALYAQSGGVTAVINASACGVIETAKQYPQYISKVLAAKDGIIGALTEELIDTSLESPEDIKNLINTPGGAFGSCRYKLKSYTEHEKEYQRLFEVFKAHDIGYFFYNGGGDSQDTAYKVAEYGIKIGFPITCIGIPKTIDNDLPFTDCCPGFGSVAKYIAISTKEAALDVASMSNSSTKVFILEVMGRHAGWIAAASGLAANHEKDAPHIILFPEIEFNETHFCQKIQACVTELGFCVVVASEGLRFPDGQFVAESGLKDSFGHAQLGGVAPALAKIVKEKLGYKYHWAVADYLQRSARHIASQVDLEQSYAVGKSAVEFAIQGKNAVMPIIHRESDNPYRWSIRTVELQTVANQEKKIPREYIQEDGYGITKLCRNYLLPLIEGEAYPPFHQGLPIYTSLKNKTIPKKLAPFMA